MKRIIVTILALLMVASLFAIEPVKTEVQLTLVLEPEYLMGVTTTAPAEGDTELKDKVTTINMTYDQSTYKLNNTSSSNHLVSYIFREFKQCTLSAALDGNLILDGASTSPATDEQVAFEADITVNDDKKNLKSSTKNSEPLVTISADATKKNQRQYGSFALVLKGSTETGDTGVKDRKIGTYKAHLVLTVTETS